MRYGKLRFPSGFGDRPKVKDYLTANLFQIWLCRVLLIRLEKALLCVFPNFPVGFPRFLSSDHDNSHMRLPISEHYLIYILSHTFSTSRGVLVKLPLLTGRCLSFRQTCKFTTTQFGLKKVQTLCIVRCVTYFDILGFNSKWPQRLACACPEGILWYGIRRRTPCVRRTAIALSNVRR